MKRFLFCLMSFVFVHIVVQGQNTRHIVLRGETLESIARNYGVTEQMIKEANPLIDEYFTGIAITVPPKPKPVVVENTTSETTSRKRRSAFAEERTYSRTTRKNDYGNVTGGYNSNYYVPDYGSFMPLMNYGGIPYSNDACVNASIGVAQSANRIYNEFNQIMNGMSQWSAPSFSTSWDNMPVFNSVPAHSSMESFSTETNNNSYSGRTPKTCSLCDGKGWIAETKGVASFGLSDKWCSECNKTVPNNHYHTTCPSCHGKGKW